MTVGIATRRSRDVAARQALAEHRLEILLDSIDDHFVQYDRHWRYTFVTAKGAAIIGKTPEQLLGRSIWDLFPEAVGNPYYVALQQAASERKVIRFEHYYAPLDKWFDNHIYPTADGITVFAADITERKQAQQALREAEGRHQALLELVPAGVYYCAAPGGEIRYFNRRAAELWGREPDVQRAPDRFCGACRLFTTDGQPMPHEQSPIVAALQGRSVRNAEAVIAREDGSRVTVLANADPVRDSQGQVIGAINVFQDISERKRAELAVERSRQELLDFVEHAAEGMHWVDAAGIIIWANRAELDMLGYSRDEYVGHHVREFHADPHIIEDIQRRLADRQVLTDHEASLRCKDGSIKQVSINSSVLFEGDRFVHTCCFTRDVTDRKQAEAVRAQLAAIVESSHDAIIGKTLQGIIVSWNAAAERLLGYPREEVIGKPVTAILPPERIAEEESLLARIRVGERVEHYETVRLHQGGEAIEVSVTLSPIRDGHGAIVGISSVAHDISERKRAERAILDREQRYRSLVEASGAIVYTSTADSSWEERNPAWEEYTGQTFEEYRGHGWINAIHVEDRGRVEASIATAFARGTTWHEEARLWHAPSRSYRYQETRAVSIRSAEGAVRAWVGTCADVHSRKLAEQAVREADRRKDEFLATLAHELRNPLAPISTSMQILRMPAAHAAKASVLDVMDRQVHHLVRLVDDLMEVARINRGTIDLRKEHLPLQDALRAALEISGDLIESFGHRLEVRLPEEPLAVHGDRVRLTQIIANLLNNAAKYTPPRGLIKVSCERAGSNVLVRVEDNGAGISAEMLGRVFDMFAQGHPSRFSGGLGIGLSLARRLAELHGGNVEGASRGENHGSEFTLRLPLAQDHAPASVPPVSAPRSAACHRVLIVDDNRDAADSLAALLEALGQQARAVHDGSEALLVGEQMRPDIVLLDLGMPTLDGFAVARELRASAWAKGARLIAVTGWGQEADRRRTREAGFDLHLVKPVDIADLRAAMGI